MRLLSADFVTSAAAGGRSTGIPADGLGQIAIAGRSNVGKSTLLNALVRRKLARTSAAPGKTRLANIFRLTVEGGTGGPGRWSLYLVDNMDEVLKVALAEPIVRLAAPTADAAEQPAISDDRITH